MKNAETLTSRMYLCGGVGLTLTLQITLSENVHSSTANGDLSAMGNGASKANMEGLFGRLDWQGNFPTSITDPQLR